MGVPILVMARRDAVKLLLGAYKERIGVFSKLPGDAPGTHDPMIDVQLRMSEWEAIYQAFRSIVED